MQEDVGVAEVGPAPETLRYPEDDPRPTSKKELAGWYFYGWAAEVFAVCAMGVCRVSDEGLSLSFFSWNMVDRALY